MSFNLRNTITSQLALLEAKIGRLAAETDERRRAWEKSAVELEEARKEAKQIQFLLSKMDEAEAQSVTPTIKEAVLDVLKRKPEGMTALEILAEINKRYFDGSIVRTSLSPQLSRLKDNDGKITLRGNRWFLNETEEPTLFTPKS
jgi:hypothetical protein